MTICSSILCLECGELYNDSTRRPCIGKCHHSICLSCKDSLESGKCPVCDEAEAFKNAIYNYETVNILEGFQKSLSEKDFERITQDMKNLLRGPCSNCHVEASKLYICTECSSVIEPGLRNLYKPIRFFQGVYLKLKSLAICANCAIDEHPEHKVVNLGNVAGMSFNLEIRTLLTLHELVEEDEQEKSLVEGFKQTYQNTLVRWKIRQHIDSVETPVLLITDKIRTDNPEWNSQLEESVENVKNWMRKLEVARRMRLMVDKERLKAIIENHKDEEAGLQKLLERFSDVSLSVEEFEEINGEIDKEIEKYSLEMSHKFPEQKPIFWRFRGVLEAYERSYGISRNALAQEEKSSKPGNVEELFSILKVLEKTTRLDFKEGFELIDKPEFRKANEEIINFQLKDDGRCVASQRSNYEEILLSLMFTRCFPIVSDHHVVLDLLSEINKIISERNALFLDSF